jgi:hypothetical protein
MDAQDSEMATGGRWINVMMRYVRLCGSSREVEAKVTSLATKFAKERDIAENSEGELAQETTMVVREARGIRSDKQRIP